MNKEIWNRVRSNIWKKSKILSLNSLSTSGYSQVSIKNKKRFVHRLVALTFISNSENKPEVNHIDSNKLNNNMNNLEWVTSKENSQHCIKIGNMPKGEKSYTSKLTEQQVKLILKSNKKHTELAKLFNTSRRNIGHIKKGESWKYIPRNNYE